MWQASPGASAPGSAGAGSAALSPAGPAPRRAARAGGARCPRRRPRAPGRWPGAGATRPSRSGRPVFCITIATFTFACARLQQLAGGVVVDARGDHQDAPGAVLQLLRRGLHVHHQVAVRLADPDHRRRRQHVEHELGGARRPSAASSPAMTSGPTPSAMVRSTKVCRSAAGSQVTKMMRAPAFRAGGEAAADERRDPAGRHADEDVAPRRAHARHRAGALVVPVLHALARLEHGRLAAGHDALHQVRRRAERRRDLGGLEHAEPPARARRR